MFANIPPDQIQFVIAQFGAFFFAFLYRQLCNIHSKKPQNEIENRNRHSLRDDDDIKEDKELNVSDSKTNNLLALAVPGLLISYLCYGHLVIHIVILSTNCYLLFLLIHPRYVHLVTLTIAMAHLSFLHFDRLFNEFTVSAADITAAIMVLVQKVTCIAFALHDGLYRSKKSDILLTTHQRAEALERIPSPLEYFAYIFNFQTVICGPLVFYSDFQDFLTATKIKQSGLTKYPSSTRVAFVNIISVSAIAIAIIVFAPLFPISLLIESTFAEQEFWRKCIIIYFVAMAARLKYYFAWKLSETISNVSGLGFAGLNADGTPNWSLMNNVDIIKFENALSFRDGIQSWNKSTELWLRRIVYERAPKTNALILTYLLSSIWHGFHPGYYLTFFTAALFTIAARFGRRTFRYRFIHKDSSWMLQWLYHAITWFLLRIALSYMIIPFVLLDLRLSFRVFSHLNFFAHIGAIVLIVASKLFNN